jgi:hypothetical protein
MSEVGATSNPRRSNGNINWTGQFSQSWISTRSLTLRSIEHAMAISEQIPIKGGVGKPKTEIALYTQALE